MIGSSKNSYFVFIFIFCIYFLNLITKNIEYPILHLIFTYKKLLFSLLCSQSFPTILSFVYENAIELILLKMKMPKNCFCNLFSFSHFLGGIENENEKKKKKKKSNKFFTSKSHEEYEIKKYNTSYF